MSGEGTSGEASNAHRQFDQFAEELAQLAKEHADELGRVNDILDESRDDADLEGLREQAKERAGQLREAVRPLPQVGAYPGSARAAAARGREHGSGMAEHLEQLGLEEAAEYGRDAISALDDAKRKGWYDDASLAEARSELQEQLEWVEQALQQKRQIAEGKARQGLNQAGDREQELSRRAGQLAERGKHGETPLPHEVVDRLERAESAMREAANALREGQGEKGRELQHEAQRLLEEANTGKTTDPDPEDGPNDGRRGMAREADVPDKQENKEARDFRQRVLEGLGKEHSGRLAPMIRRYVEGLLR
jgi:hypothetical protein